MVSGIHDSRKKIAEALEDCLRSLGGEKSPTEISSEMDVLKTWVIDSLHGIELACEIGPRLNINIPLEENPLVEDNKETGQRRGRTFGEVVDYLAKIVGV